ncbi:phosphotransferase family protein [Arthrobacter sp. H14]|uniref:phosphotransferase family protein n=1 Tax=Arthrobacter sp. H14 TaxID=1312959 RepID=UPI00055DE154|nr:aminoglycoside phosphotransferase family protein [Arthrobacter sp. H14]
MKERETAVVALDPELPALDWVMDADRLSELLGKRLEPVYLRYKPGRSVLASVRDENGRFSWVAGYTPASAHKMDKTVQRSSGQDVCNQQSIPGAAAGHTLLAAPIELDRALYKPLRKLREPGIAMPTADAGSEFGAVGVEVLNYNPGRRLVISAGPVDGRKLAVKISSTRSRGSLHARLRESTVPVLGPLTADRWQHSRHIAYYPWVDGGDLLSLWRRRSPTVNVGQVSAGSIGRATVAGPRPATETALSGAYQAGGALAALHRVPISSSNDGGGSSSAAKQLGKAIRVLGLILPPLAGRLDALPARLAARLDVDIPPALLHGDFSPDQVLMDGPEALLIDFDRSGIGPAASDLGSFAAVELLQENDTGPAAPVQGWLTGCLVDGYRAAGGHITDDQLRIWCAFHLGIRLTMPFRRCDPHWPAAIERQLTLVEELLR